MSKELDNAEDFVSSDYYPSFVQEWQCEPPKPNPIAKFAEEYHERCDFFDELICPPGGRPITSRDGVLINRHAKAVIKQIAKRMYENGMASSLRGAELLLREAIRSFPVRR